MLSLEEIQELIKSFPDLSLIEVGCHVKRISYDFCFKDVALFPSDLQPMIFDEKKRIIVFGIKEPGTLDYNSRPIYDPQLRYGLAVVRDSKGFLREKARSAVLKSLSYLSYSSSGPFFYASAASLLEAVAAIGGSTISPSHFFTQINSANSQIANRLLAILEPDANIGEILAHRLDVLASYQERGRSEITLKKALGLISNSKSLEASIFFFHEYAELGVERIQRAGREFMFGEVESKKMTQLKEIIMELVNLIK
ncbi:MAG: hypothetical protein ACP5GH_01585 [Nitrososphaeria archaeon]